MDNQTVARKSFSILLALLVLFGLYLSSLYSYLLFHSIVELFSIVVAWAIFAIAWNSRRLVDNNYLLFVGISFLFTGSMDLVHTLAYKGMGVFTGYDANLPTQLWIAARYTQSLSLLFAPFLLGKKLRLDFALAGFALVTVLLLASIFGGVFPACFVEGVGLTPFKKVSEYIISLILLVSAFLLVQKRAAFDKGVLQLLVASIILTIGAELAFTTYFSVYGFSNMLGHLFKVVAFYLVYKALIETGLRKPYELLFRNLKQSEEVLTQHRYELEKVVSEQTTALKTTNANLLKEIAERTRAEERARASYELFQRLFHSSPFPTILNKLPERTVVDVNAAFEKVTGYTRVEVLGKSISDFDLWGNPEERDRVAQTLIKTGKVSDYEFVLKTKSGRIRTGVFYAELLEHQGERLALVKIVDITERKRADEEIARFKISSDIAAYGLAMLSAERKITYANKTCADLHGYTQEELIGQHCTTFIPEDQLERVDKLFQELGRNSSFQDQEVIHKRKDGTTFPVLMSGVAIKDGNGKVLFSSIQFIDITEQKKMQAQLILTDRLVSLGQLVSGVAHELNNPLTSIVGFSELLMQKPDLPDDVRNDLKIIDDEARRTSEIVKGLLVFARKQKTEKEPLEINSIIQSVLKLRSYEHKINNIEVNTRLAPNLPAVLVNRGQMQQVLINLVVNAEQAMLEAHNRGTFIISTEQVGDIIKTSVSDDGTGIGPENMGKLFTPFFTTKAEGKGSGLGLSICHGIIAEHGSKIYAQSEPGKGATFIVELPVADGEPA